MEQLLFKCPRSAGDMTVGGGEGQWLHMTDALAFKQTEMGKTGLVLSKIKVPNLVLKIFLL